MISDRCKGKEGAKGQDTDGDGHIINQLRKIVDMHDARIVRFLDDTCTLVTYPLAVDLIIRYNNLRTSIQKEEMILAIWKSAEAFERMHFLA